MRKLNLLRIVKQLETGSTGPLLVRAHDPDNDETIDLVLKLTPPPGHSHERFPQYVVCAEIIGTHILHSLGLEVPEPFWVSMTPTVIENYRNPTIRDRLLSQPSHLFGCRYLPSSKYAPVTVNTPLKDDKHLEECHTLFGGDNWILNADRGRNFGAVNLMVSTEHIHPYDQGCAFTRLLNKETADDIILDIGLQQNHIAFEPIKRRKKGFYDEEFDRMIAENVTDELIDSLRAFCYEAGIYDFTVQKIFDHLKSKLSKIPQFRAHLNLAFH